MRLYNGSNFNIIYHDSQINDYAEKLEKEGYVVQREVRIFDNYICDLLATKGNEKIIYEFKVVKDKNQKDVYEKKLNIAKLRDKALKENYGFKVIYLTVPRKKTIEIEWLGSSILDYINSNIVTDIDILSTHSRIEDIYINDIEGIYLESDIKLVNVDATLYIKLQYGSDNEADENTTSNITFPINFNSIILNYDKEVEDAEYDIDLDSFYE